MKRPALLALALLGCGTGGDPGGGAAQLPNRGFVPYEKLTEPPEPPEPPEGDAGAPDPITARLIEGTGDRRPSHPFALALPGGSVRLFVQSCPPPGEGPCRVEQASATDGRRFGPLQIALEDPARSIETPYVRRRGAGWAMWVSLDGGAAIGRALSDDGLAFRDLEIVLLPEAGYERGGISSPSLIELDGGRELYYQATGPRGGPAVAVATQAVGASGGFRREGVMLQAGVGCSSAYDEPSTCWDAAGVSDPEVRVSHPAAGGALRRMVYSGPTGQIGFALSADGNEWSRFAFNPVLAEDERQPTNLRTADRYLLYFVQGRVPQGISGAVNDAGRPSERF